MIPKFATHYENRKKHSIDFKDCKSRTLQSDAYAADINNILKKYQKTGILPDLIKQNPRYGDFSEVPQYQDALNVVQMANDQFNSLEAHVRRRFDNNPEKFLEFMHNGDNIEEMIKMGLATRKPDPLDPSKPSEEVKK